jgi:predicted phosphodiesterase
MSKICLISDTHFGIRGDSLWFLDNNKKFFDNIFFPTLKERNIRTVIHLGDMVDRRKYISYNTSQRLRQDFIQPLFHMTDYIYHILGNHDVFHRNNLDLSFATELEIGSAINIIDEPGEILIDDLRILFVPWICQSNRQACLSAIQTSTAKICMGHFEIAGFEMNKGVIKHDGEDSKLFRNFSRIFSGHYHHASSVGNISYLGSHDQFDWGDYGDSRGFYIFDTETLETEFVENKYVMYQKVFYDDANNLCFPSGTYKDKIVKVIVKSKKHPAHFDLFVSAIESQKPYELSVVNDHHNKDVVSVENILSEGKSTLEIINEVVQSSNDVVDSAKLQMLFQELYQEAMKNEV